MMIKLYSKTVCPKCMLVKSLFNNNEIEYETINIENDTEAKQKILDEGFMAVPIVEYNDKFYSNMDQFQSLIDELKWLSTYQELEMSNTLYLS